MARSCTEENLNFGTYVLLCRVLPRGKWYWHCPGFMSWLQIQEFRDSAKSKGLKTLALSRNEWAFIGMPTTPDAEEYFDIENQRKAGKGGSRGEHRRDL